MDYRLYFFDQANEHISAAAAFDAEDDDRAIGMAQRQHAAGCRMELWQRARLVKAWQAGLAASHGPAIIEAPPETYGKSYVIGGFPPPPKAGA